MSGEVLIVFWSVVSVLSAETAEKVVLIGLISVVFGRVLPGVQASDLELFVGIGILVLINAAWSIVVAARARTVESVWLAGIIRFGFNVAVVWGFAWLLGAGGGGLDLGNAAFFLFLLSLLAVLHDRYRPVAGVRFPG